MQDDIKGCDAAEAEGDGLVGWAAFILAVFEYSVDMGESNGDYENTANDFLKIYIYTPIFLVHSSGCV